MDCYCNIERDIWCDFSSRCGEKYDEDECHTQWDRMVKKDMSIGTLRHFASVDNPELYNELRCEQVKKYIHQYVFLYVFLMKYFLFAWL